VINFEASPTGQAFVDSRAFVKGIMGPVGGGKSTVALFDLFQRSLQQVPYNGVRRTKFIILRNTIQQLKSTVKPLIDQWFVSLMPTPLGQWRVTDNTFDARFRLEDGTIVHSEYLMMAADTPDDVRRLLSVECSAAWVEEAREVDQAVFEGLQGRVARFPNRAAGGVTYPGVIFSTNPPPLGTYWHGLISAPPNKHAVFVQPPAMLEDGALNPDAENLLHLDPEYYDNLIAGKSSGWIDVYVKNQFGAGDFGKPVFRSTFKRDFHVSKTALRPVLQSVNPLIVGMDNGLTAAAVIGQQDARGRVNLLGQAYVPDGETMGVETFLDRLLLPVLRNQFPSFRPDRVLFVLDPACFQRSQVDEKTIAQAVMTRGYQVKKAQTNDPERRVSAVEGLLTRQIDGAAALLIDPNLGWLIDALDWGYRYKKSASGQGTTQFDKGPHSHIAEAFQYFALHYNAESEGGVWRRNTQARPVVAHKYAYT
jgi:hypothetical protein